MTGIAACAVYLPRYRLGRDVIAAAWGSRAPAGRKIVKNFDEDTLTMGHAAASRLLAAGAPCERLWFASTTSPYWQRSVSSQIAASCDLPAEAETCDFAGSLRCGTTALRLALESGKPGFVVASEARDGAPESIEEMQFSDAAAGVAVGTENLLAEFAGSATRSDDFLDEWRRDGDAHVRSYASKYSRERGCQANVEAVASLLPAAKRAMADENAGAATPLLALAQAIAAAVPGELFLVAGYGEGADALLFRRTDRPAPPAAADSRAIEHTSYARYRKLRENLRASSDAAELSNVLWEREEPQNLRLRGTRCPACGTVQFPMTRVCVSCHNREGLVQHPLARRGRVFTFTKDFLYEAPVQPTVMAVVDLDGGGRFLCQMTDAEADEVAIGMLVELVLRRMREGAGAHHYYWKCRPAGEEA